LRNTKSYRASGGELLESLTKQEYVTESEIAGYIRQVLLGLQYMHNQNIAHLGLTVITPHSPKINLITLPFSLETF
jgi:serine/threonine protein kinase